MKKLSKTEAESEIREFFSNIENKTPKQIQKVKRLAMSHNIQLKELRKKFCKKCYSPNLKVRDIKNGKKSVECRNCRSVMSWKIK